MLIAFLTQIPYITFRTIIYIFPLNNNKILNLKKFKWILIKLFHFLSFFINIVQHFLCVCTGYMLVSINLTNIMGMRTIYNLIDTFLYFQWRCLGLGVANLTQHDMKLAGCGLRLNRFVSYSDWHNWPI